MFDPGSFRDPASRVGYEGNLVQRILTEQGQAHWAALERSRLFREWTASGGLIGTHADPVNVGVLNHDRIPFWSYPYEWSFSMLREAARLQLDILQAALADGLTLKDSTPYNIQFRGIRPVFIDIGSFRPYSDGEPWLGYGQFCRQFLYPIMIQAHAGIPFQPWLRGSLDGIDPEHARRVLGGPRRLRPGVTVDVVLQARATRRTASDRDLRGELTAAGFKPEMITANVRRLRRVIDQTEWSPSTSTWSEYAACGHVGKQRTAKAEFVQRVIGDRRRRLIWDLGANDGYFSRLVAPMADLVVAADADDVVVDQLFRSLQQDGPGNILPLVFDLSDPSPGLGWRGRERRRFEDRAHPDLVLLLAIVHHLVIAGNLPIEEIIEWLASLQTEVVFEWVPPEDAMARRLMVSKRPEEIHPDYREGTFRSLLKGRFEVANETRIEGRTLLHLIPR
ncbi:MAG: methyltransferase [Actinomycetota bacterium]